MFHFLVLPRVLSHPASATKTSERNEDTESTRTKSDLEVTPQLATDNLPSAVDLSSLRALLNSKNVSKEQAKETILSLKEDALSVKAEIEQEMEKRYGFIWDVWIGFHGAPSME